jgi:glycosyltransferase involved in cell wall biosynthesis
MKLSICILTHNRPELFTRAINSILSNHPDVDYEIRINNDSRDITEIPGDNIYYSYYKDKDLSNVYRYLFDSSVGEYIYYLEDDDYIHPTFFNNLNFEYDINYMLYTSVDHITYYGPKQAIKRQRLNRHLMNVTDYKTFIANFNDKYFQLGQILFRKDCIEEFPSGNNLNNDYILFSECINVNSTIKYIDRQLWTQTTDGKDNISFEELNKDERFC